MCTCIQGNGVMQKKMNCNYMTGMPRTDYSFLSRLLCILLMETDLVTGDLGDFIDLDDFGDLGDNGDFDTCIDMHLDRAKGYTDPVYIGFTKKGLYIASHLGSSGAAECRKYWDAHQLFINEGNE